MDMKINIRYALLALMASPAVMQAQTQQPDTTLNRTVVVEQEYTPNIRDARKVNVLPQVEPPTVTPKDVVYDTDQHPVGLVPADNMQAYTGKEEADKATWGYLRAGYGNYGNLDARAGYRFRLSDSDRLGITFGMDGMDGTLDMADGDGEWEAFFYRTRAAVDYTHSFRTVDLDVAGHFGLSNFRQLPETEYGKQKFTSGDVHVGAASTGGDLPLQFRAETNLMLYRRQHGLDFDEAKEVAVHTSADVWGYIDDVQAVGINFGMDNMVYRDNGYENYTAIGLNPYYTYDDGRWKMRLGAHVNPSLGFGKKFYASPDVDIQYALPARTVLYMQAKGGKLLNGFRRLELISPYADPSGQPDATYEQLNAAIGIKAGTLSGFHIHVYGGYQVLKNDLYFTEDSGSGLLFEAWDTENFYAGIELQYDYRGIFSFSGSGIYRNWSAGNGGKAAGVLDFKPAFEGNVEMAVRPINPLRIYVGYRNTTRTEVDGESMEPVNDLYLGAGYDLFKDLALYARMNNIMNKKYLNNWFCPAEGINFMVGASFRF